jgi:hypothetical protein
MQQEFERPNIPLEKRKDRWAREGAAAMADYKRAQDRVLERMIELRRMRLEKQQRKNNGQQ